MFVTIRPEPEWSDAVTFYAGCGFQQYGSDEVDIHLRLLLDGTVNRTRRPDRSLCIYSRRCRGRTEVYDRARVALPPSDAWITIRGRNV